MDTQTQQNSPREKPFKELNGINLEAFNKAVKDVIENPLLLEFKFRASNEWIKGGKNRSVILPFYGKGKELSGNENRFILNSDEPAVFLGADEAPNPLEYILHALLSDLTSTLVYHAAASGISIKSLKSQVEGDLNMQGFLGISKKSKKGFKEIRIKFMLETNAQISDLKELLNYSPVFEMLSSGVPIKVDFEISKPVLN